MNPCAKNKRRLAWMAADLLEADEAKALRAHLERCPGCRNYWQDLSDLSERLAKVKDLPEVDLPASFHGQVRQRIHELEKPSLLFQWASNLRHLLLERRLAAVTAAVIIGIGMLLWRQGLREEKQRNPRPDITVQRAAPPVTSPPTLASYRRAAEISLESLDALLTKEVVHNGVTIETFTVASLLAPSAEN
jgi:hypothetical protein